MARSVTIVKLGGSLLTDKRGREALRRDVLQRLAGEIAAAREARPDDLVILGHGSGSFGHVAAAESGVGGGPLDLDDGAVRLAVRLGVARVQDAAARLHREVVAALLDAGVPTFSFAASSACVARGGRITAGSSASLVRALRAGLVPVVYGDVVTDQAWTAAIASTEEVVRFLVPRLARDGHPVTEVLWLGETAGILDADGATVPVVDRETFGELRRAMRPAAGTDVTGGMLLRLVTARELARAGVASTIFDGTVPGSLEAALNRDPGGAPPTATRFLPDPRARKSRQRRAAGQGSAEARDG